MATVATALTYKIELIVRNHKLYIHGESKEQANRQ